MGCFLLLPFAPPDQTTRIRSSNCNMCQTALNLEPQSPLSVRVRYPFLVFLQTRAICLRQKEGSGAHWRSRRRWWPLKSLRKVGIVGFGIERCCLHAAGGSGGAENQNTELSIRTQESLDRWWGSPEKKKSVQFALRRDIN